MDGEVGCLEGGWEVGEVVVVAGLLVCLFPGSWSPWLAGVGEVALQVGFELCEVGWLC